jgi:magnesium-transporting ATPase (P-type)
MAFEIPEKASWHALSAEETLKRLRTSEDGLTPEEVLKRREHFGRNHLPGKEPPGLFSIILHQFKSPLIYILIVAGVLAAHGLHILALHLPVMQVILRTEPVSPARWAVLLLLALPLLGVMEIYKRVRARKWSGDREQASES